MIDPRACGERGWPASPSTGRGFSAIRAALEYERHCLTNAERARANGWTRAERAWRADAARMVARFLPRTGTFDGQSAGRNRRPAIPTQRLKGQPAVPTYYILPRSEWDMETPIEQCAGVIAVGTADLDATIMRLSGRNALTYPSVSRQLRRKGSIYNAPARGFVGVIVKRVV